MLNNRFPKMKFFYSRKNERRPFLIFGLMFLLLTVNQQTIMRAPTFQDDYWSPPQKMPVYDLTMDPPILVSDQNRTVHAFSSQLIGSPGNEPIRVIVYNKWTLENGWTYPVDILMSPVKEARLTDVYLDKNGVFHMTFFGGDNTSADIYYTKTLAARVEDPRSWSTPLIIGENAGDPAVAALVEDDQGTIHVIYNGRQFGNGLYVVESIDGSENWTSPAPMFFTQTDEPNVAQLTFIKGRSGWFHAIWGVFNVAGQGRGIYYARSENGVDWSEPVLLADVKDGLGTQKPTIIEYEGKLFGVYLKGIEQGMKVIMRYSRDDGETWDDPFIVFPRHIGMNGELSLLVDGNGDLHLFFGERIPGSPDIHGMWHSRFDNNRWLEPEAVTKGPRVVDPEGGSGFDPNYARAVLSQGNRILLTWKTDPAAGPNGIWYSYLNIDAPELPLATLPSAKLQETQAVSPDASLTVTPGFASTTPPPGKNPTSQLFADQNQETMESRAIYVFAGIVFTILLTATVAMSYKSRRK